MAHAGADQCFCRIGTDAADAENGHSLCGKKINALFTDNAGGTYKIGSITYPPE